MSQKNSIFLEEEAIRALTDLGAAVSDPVTHVLPDGTGVLLLDRLRGTVLRETLFSPPRKYTASTIRGFGEMVRDFAAALALPEGNASGFAYDDIRVYVGKDSAVCILDERGARRDVLTLPLRESASYAALRRLFERPSTQEDLVWSLKSDFRADMFSPATFLPWLSALKFSSSEDGDSTIAAGKQSSGARVESRVSGGGGDAPPFVTFSTPVFDCLSGSTGTISSVACAFGVDLKNRTFRLKPQDGELYRAVDNALSRVADEIESVISKTPGGSDGVLPPNVKIITGTAV